LDVFEWDLTPLHLTNRRSQNLSVPTQFATGMCWMA